MLDKIKPWKPTSKRASTFLPQPSTILKSQKIEAKRGLVKISSLVQIQVMKEWFRKSYLYELFP